MGIGICCISCLVGRKKTCPKVFISWVWSNYSDLTQPGPNKGSFLEGSHPLISGQSSSVKYYNDMTVDSNCQHRQTKDTREHSRLLFCKELHETSIGKAKLIQWLKKQKIATRSLSLVPLCRESYLVLYQHQRVKMDFTYGKVELRIRLIPMIQHIE